MPLTDNGGIFLVIEATEGQSNGVTRTHSKAVAINIAADSVLWRRFLMAISQKMRNLRTLKRDLWQKKLYTWHPSLATRFWTVFAV